MAKKLKANVNGVDLKDGELVTLVIHARMTVRAQTAYNGKTYTYVEFEDKDQHQWFEADRDDSSKENGPYTLPGVTIIRTES